MESAYIQKRLYELADTSYKRFMVKLLPTVDESRVIGVRNPQMRALVRELIGRGATVETKACAQSFLAELPHVPELYELNMVHAMLLSTMRMETSELRRAIEAFLPYVDNWAVCDCLSPKAFKKKEQGQDEWLLQLLASEHTYTVRFAMGMLMQHYIQEDFDVRYMDAIVAKKSDEYYVNMMRAWYMAEALIWQKEAALPVIEERRLDSWTHRKAIAKYVESRRPTEEEKAYLKRFRN